MNKKLKKTVVVLMSSVALGGFILPTNTTFAAEQSQHDIQKETVEQEIEMLEKSNKYEFELVPIETIDENNLIQLNSVDELENILEEIKINNETDFFFDDTAELPGTNLLQSRAAGSKNISQWAPFSGYGMTGMACWRNVSFKYDYKKVNGKNQFTKVSGINSYYSGIQIAVSWKQTSSSYNFAKTSATNDTVKIKVNGYSLLGFQINGFTVGAKINSTWNVSHKI